MVKNHECLPLPTIAKVHFRAVADARCLHRAPFQRAEWRGRLQAREQLKRGKPLPVIYEIRPRRSTFKVRCRDGRFRLLLALAATYNSFPFDSPRSRVRGRGQEKGLHEGDCF